MTKPNLVGENVTGYRYIAHLNFLAVQAGFYSDVVECSLSTRENLVRSPSGKKEFFFACYTCIKRLLILFVMTLLKLNKPAGL